MERDLRSRLTFCVVSPVVSNSFHLFVPAPFLFPAFLLPSVPPFLCLYLAPPVIASLPSISSSCLAPRSLPSRQLLSPTWPRYDRPLLTTLLHLLLSLPSALFSGSQNPATEIEERNVPTTRQSPPGYPRIPWPRVSYPAAAVRKNWRWSRRGKWT